MAKTNAAPSIKEQFISEIENILGSKNPEPSPTINFIWVLSGRSSFLKEPVDHPNVLDKDDDNNRMQLGIDTARVITALKTNKSIDTITEQDMLLNGPQIIYNGRAKHNIDLKFALDTNLITSYPKEKFLIYKLPEENISTKSQFLSIKKEIDLKNEDIVIITHAFHFSRVARMLEASYLSDYFSTVGKIYFFLFDRNFQAPGAKIDLAGELERINKYIEQGDLCKEFNQKTIIYQGEPCTNFDKDVLGNLQFLDTDNL